MEHKILCYCHDCGRPVINRARTSYSMGEILICLDCSLTLSWKYNTNAKYYAEQNGSFITTSKEKAHTIRWNYPYSRSHKP